MVNYHIVFGEPLALFHTVPASFSGALWGFSTIVEAQGVMGRTKMTASDVSIYVEHSLVSSEKISWTLPKMDVKRIFQQTIFNFFVGF